MKFAYVMAASLAAAATAEEFYWNKNNNFGSMSNWAVDGVDCTGDTPPEGCPSIDRNDVITFSGPMTIPEASSCDKDNSWAGDKGRVLKMDSSIEIGKLTLPSNGKLMLGDKISMSFNEGLKAKASTEWKCKDLSETNWKCGANWNTGGFNGEVAHRVPCASDTVIFPDDSKAYQVNVPQNTFVQAIRIENPDDYDVQSTFVANGGDYEISDQSEVNRFFTTYSSQFQGGVASVLDECGDEDACEQFCHNHCAELDDNVEGQRRFLVNAMEKQLARVDAYADKVNTKMAPDEALDTTVKIGGKGTKVAKNAITGFDELEAAFEAKYASLFRGDDGIVKGGDADAVSLIFQDDLVTHIGSLKMWGVGMPRGQVCSVTATGGVTCPIVKDFTTSYGKARDVTAQVWYALDLYFCQDCREESGVISGTQVELNKDGNGFSNYNSGPRVRDIDFVFGYSDCDFSKTRYASGQFPKVDGVTSGFLSKDECDVIEATMDMGYAAVVLQEYDSLSTDEQKAFREAVMAEVELTSVLEVESASGWYFDDKAEAKDPAKTHTFDQARFYIKVGAQNLPQNFDMDSIRAAFAAAFWHQIASNLMPAYALREFNQYTSTTTTTVTTTTVTTSTVTIEFDINDFSEAEKSATETKDKEVLVAELKDAEAAQKEAVDALDAAVERGAPQEERDALLKVKQQADKAYVKAVRLLELKNDQLEKELAASKAELDGALPIIPILAGAGGLVVILIIIIAVVSSKGGGGGPSDAYGRGDASVVAFENPMYDDPGHATENPLAGADEDDDGGLYDEPAFNAEEEADDGATGGGYLDVEPDDEDDEDDEESAEESSEEEESEEEESSEEDDE